MTNRALSRAILLAKPADFTESSIEFVPMTVMGLPLSPGAGTNPVASPVA
jgi:hypothetical protein